MKKFLDKFTFTNFLKYGLFQWMLAHIIYNAACEGILVHYGIWKPFWHIKENWVIAAELYRDCIWCWVPGILYFILCGFSIWNENRIEKKEKGQ